MAWRQIEWVMRYQDFLDAIGKPAELSLYLKHLPVVDTAAFDHESAGRVDTGDRDFIVEVEGLQVIGDVLLIYVKRATKPCINVV